MLGLRAKAGSINRAKDVSPLRVGTLRSLLRSYKTRICNYFHSMFRQAQHDRNIRCCGWIYLFNRLSAPGGLIGHNYLILCAHGYTGLVLGLKKHVTASVAKQSFYKQPQT